MATIRRALVLSAVLACSSGMRLAAARDTPAVGSARARGAMRARAPVAKRPTMSTAAANAQGDSNEGMSISASSVALAKNIVGGGMLALPAGMAAATGTGFGPAIGLCVFSALASAYTFVLVGSGVERTGATSFRELWKRSIGPKSAWIVDATIIGIAFSATVMYGCFFGDLIPALIPSLSRAQALVGVSSLILLPLALQKDLSALAFTSYTGIAAVIYTAVVIVRRWLDGSYAAAGRFLADGVGAAAVPFAPLLGQRSALGLSAGTFVLFNMLSTAYMAHTNAVRFYGELRRKSVNRFAAVCGIGFGAAALAHALVMVAGYATFGGATQGLILNNYHLSKDALATGARVATGVSILGSHPLLFTSLRDAVLSCVQGTRLGDAVASSTRAWAALTAAMLALVTLVAIVATDVGFVASVSGASLGALLIFVWPALIDLKLAKARNAGSSGRAMLARGTIGFGVLMCILGTIVTCLETFTNVFAG